MTLWNPRRSPDKYPTAFHAALGQGEGQAILATVATQAEAEVVRKRWRAFCASLRNFPLHRLHDVLEAHDTRTSAVEQPEGTWQVLVIVKRKTGKILQQALDNLG